MAAFNENPLNRQNENLRHIHPTDELNNGQKGENTGSGPLESNNPYTKAENPAGNLQQDQSSTDLEQEEAYGENAGILNTNSILNSDQTRGPGGDDDDLVDDDEDDLLDDEDEDTLIPIEGDEEDDSLLSADEDEDVIPGTDMDDGDDLLDDDDDLDDEDSGVNRSTTGDLGTNVTGRNDGRGSGRMIDHEPGAGI